MLNAMWSGQNKVWMHYLNDIIAADVASAVFLSSYMRIALRGRSNAIFHEVADLQRYKLIRTPKKVRAAMIGRVHLPFVFVLSKN
jgi:hypothetical protein